MFARIHKRAREKQMTELTMPLYTDTPNGTQVKHLITMQYGRNSPVRMYCERIGLECGCLIAPVTGRQDGEEGGARQRERPI